MEFIEEIHLLKLRGQLELGACARSKHAMQKYYHGTCNTVKTEAIGGGAVENELSLYSWELDFVRGTNAREYCQLSPFPKLSSEYLTLPLVELR